MYLLYNSLLFVAALFALPYYAMKMFLTGKYRESISQKLGFILGRGIIESKNGSPRIWFHAVSVGEVTAAAPIIAALRVSLSRACIVLSTSTETGQKMARKILPAETSIFYYPLDIPAVVRRVIKLVKPDIFVPMETELWPNFIRTCKEHKIKIILVNGRISPRSFKRYLLTRFFWEKILNEIDEIGVISATDAGRLMCLGMPTSRIHILGNAKYDSLAARTSPELQKDISLKLNLTPKDKVLVAGSTHEGEEEIILSLYRRILDIFPDFKLIIIPRHIERATSVLALIRREGFEDVVTMSEINGGRKRQGERLIIVDVIGELFRVYSLATVVFCGGSLVPKGGQNILEAAAWGKVIFYGPFMDDFQDEKALLEDSGAGKTVNNGDELFMEIVKLVNDPEMLVRKGERGREAVVANMGASHKYADLIIKQLPHL